MRWIVSNEAGLQRVTHKFWSEVLLGCSGAGKREGERRPPPTFFQGKGCIVNVFGTSV